MAGTILANEKYDISVTQIIPTSIAASVDKGQPCIVIIFIT